MAPSINFGQANQSALADYFIQRYNLVGRDAEYSKNRPTLGYIPRDDKQLSQQETLKVTLKIANGFAGSPDWVEGNKNFNPSKTVRWSVDYPYAEYAKLSFDTLTLNRTPMGTLLDVKGEEADGVRDSMLDTMEFQLWNDGTAARGQAATVSGTSTVTATLSNANDVYNFPIGAVLTANTARDGSGTAHTNRYRVSDFDPIAGTLTLIRTIDNSSAVANNDYLHVVGSANLYMPGIPAFIPSAAPADTFFGVTRTANPALSGWRFPFKASISETIQRAFSKMGQWVNRSAGRYSVCLSTTDWLLLSMEREGRVFENPGAMQTWGLEGLTVRTASGPITCIAIPQIPDGRGYIIDWTTWKLFTLKNLPHVVDEDGMTFVRGGTGTPDGVTQGDLLQLQFRRWSVLLCRQPLSNATFPTA